MAFGWGVPFARLQDNALMVHVFGGYHDTCSFICRKARLWRGANIAPSLEVLNRCQ